MAGGPSTPALTAAVANAGGYGTVAAGYLTADSLREAIATTRTMTAAPFGVNLFMPSVAGDPAEIATYAALLQPEAERLAVALGEPRWDDDSYEAKLDVVTRPPEFGPACVRASMTLENGSKERIDERSTSHAGAGRP
jgi:nitronate monooxygenase